MALPDIQENVLERTRLERPGKYNVVFLNDDFTPMELVTYILEHVFFLRAAEAESLMMKVHLEGKAVVGCYVLDIARSKADKAEEIARGEGYPLRVVVERCDD